VDSAEVEIQPSTGPGRTGRGRGRGWIRDSQLGLGQRTIHHVPRGDVGRVAVVDAAHRVQHVVHGGGGTLARFSNPAKAAVRLFEQLLWHLCVVEAGDGGDIWSGWGRPRVLLTNGSRGAFDRASPMKAGYEER